MNKAKKLLIVSCVAAGAMGWSFQAQANDNAAYEYESHNAGNQGFFWLFSSKPKRSDAVKVSSRSNKKYGRKKYRRPVLIGMFH